MSWSSRLESMQQQGEDVQQYEFAVEQQELNPPPRGAVERQSTLGQLPFSAQDSLLPGADLGGNDQGYGFYVDQQYPQQYPMQQQQQQQQGEPEAEGNSQQPAYQPPKRTLDTFLASMNAKTKDTFGMWLFGEPGRGLAILQLSLSYEHQTCCWSDSVQSG